MAYSNINKPNEYFNTVLYTGTGSSQSIDTGFQTDWTWIKKRSGSANHCLYDTIRGATKTIHSDVANAESIDAQLLTAFETDGFTVGTGANVNESSATFVSWNWLAGGTASSNTDGSITSNVSANTTSGFSVVTWTGTGANATVGHGLTSAPQMIILKNRDSAENWIVGNTSLGWTNYLALNLTDSVSTASNIWQDTAPTSSVFSIGASGKVNGSTHGMVAYCFADVKGFSKFGSYTGNGNADGTFVYTGFKPAWVLIKQTNSSNIWELFDNKRSPFNLVDDYLSPDASDAETTGSSQNLDFLSNGFKPRSSGSGLNGSGSSYIYMAFAENPLVAGNYVPTTAR